MSAILEPEYAQPTGGWTRNRIIFLSVSAVLLLALFVAVREVLLPFVLGITIAYVLMPLVVFGERRLRMPRSLSIVAVYLVVFGTLGFGVSEVGPRLYEETVRVARDMPGLVRRLAAEHGPQLEAWVSAYRGSAELPAKDRARPALTIQDQSDGSRAVSVGSGLEVVEEAPGRWRVNARDTMPANGFRVSELVDQGIEHFVRYIELNALVVLQLGRTILSSIARAIFLTFMVLMVAGYIMYTREGILAFFKSLLPPRHRPGWEHLLARVDRGLSGVVRGQLLICVVNGLLSAIGFWIFGLKYWPILALAAAVLSIIPIFGAILSSIPAVFVGLTQDVFTAVWVLVWILGIHQVEANLLNPKIIGASAKIHPVLVVFSLLVGEHYFGLWGALLAVPALSLSQSIFNHFRFSTLEDPGPDSMGIRELLQKGGS